NSCATRARRRIGRIKQPKRVRRPKIRRNSPRVVVPKPKGSRYAQITVLALSNTTIDKLGLYVEKIRNGQVQYSPIHKLIEILPTSRFRSRSEITK
ncbi:25898_t:CDS:2, partial [Racocetra persica]